MKKIFGITVVAAIVSFASCGEDVEKNAQALVGSAREAYEQSDFQKAKLLLDSVKCTYPTAFKARRKAIVLMRDVELGEQMRSLDYYKSELARLSAERDSILPSFVLEKDSRYQDIGNYMKASQTIKNNLGNSYLRAQVDENGVATITSVYRGKPIGHTSVKVLSGDNYVECSSPLNTYSSRHLGVTTERVDFRYGQDGGLMDFISTSRSAVTVELSGEKKYKYSLRASDASAIAEVLNLARLLQAIDSLKAMRDEAERHIEFINYNKQKYETKEQ